ncbi:MAG: hypothetical protein O3C45_05630, partial [Bacteroidetes bacterium]|nr:hypothetical protein [Bacteroidota bacterium]
MDIDAAEADRLLGFYLGSYLGPEGGDPVAAGLLEKRENSWFLRSPSSVAGAHQALQSFFDRFREAGNVPADTLESFLRASYYTARQTPPTLDAFRQLSGAWSEPDWFRVDVTGSMVPAPRVTWVRREAIQHALEQLDAPDEPILYPVGTQFVGEHIEGERIVETTVMQKRADGYWDFWVYGADGVLTDRVRKEPRDLVVPTRCTGCHFGDRAFEPERS